MFRSTYKVIDDKALRYDLAMPPKPDGQVPLIICIHGGGWSLGSRDSLISVIKYLAEQGFAAATIDYRLSPQYRFPAHIEDVKAAVRYFRANAEKYNIDPNRIGAVGFSAGGHLALMLGLMDPEDGMEGEGDHLDQSSKVQAVVNFFGSVDFRTWRVSEEAQKIIQRSYKGKRFEDVLAGVFGAYDPDAPVMAAASPITYADSNDPPILTFHGKEDTQVPYTQATAFHHELDEIGTPNELVTLADQTHGWQDEALNQTLKQTAAFFAEKLK